MITPPARRPARRGPLPDTPPAPGTRYQPRPPEFSNTPERPQRSYAAHAGHRPCAITRGSRRLETQLARGGRAEESEITEAAAALLAAFVVDGVDREHDGQDEHLVDVVSDIDLEFLPQRQLSGDRGDQLATLVYRVVPPAEVALGGDPTELRLNLVVLAEEAFVAPRPRAGR